MITKFITAFMNKKESIANKFAEKHLDNYSDIVKIVIGALHNDEDP